MDFIDSPYVQTPIKALPSVAIGQVSGAVLTHLKAPIFPGRA